MDILIIAQGGQHQIIKNCASIPRVGEKVDFFYQPLPVVTSVIWFPSNDRLAAINVDDAIEAIITVA